MFLKCGWILFILFANCKLSCVFANSFLNCTTSSKSRQEVVTFDCAALKKNINTTEYFNNFNQEKCSNQWDNEFMIGLADQVFFENCRMSFPQKFFQRYDHIREVYLEGCGIQTFDDRSFLSDRGYFVLLSLAHNNLTKLPENLFTNARTLKNLDFSYNQISRIDPNTFRGALLLERLNLAHNKIKTIDEYVFSDLTD